MTVATPENQLAIVQQAVLDVSAALPDADLKPKDIEGYVLVDKLAALCLGAGTLSLGVAGGLFIASNGNRDAAALARTLGDHDELADRADAQRVGTFIAAGAGVALIGVAIFRWTRGDEPSASGVAVVPATGGGTVAFSTQW